MHYLIMVFGKNLELSFEFFLQEMRGSLKLMKTLFSNWHNMVQSSSHTQMVLDFQKTEKLLNQLKF